MKDFFWIVALVGAALGGLVVLWTLNAAGSAPQEAAGFAMGLALAAIPYCLARAVEKLSGRGGRGEAP